MSELLVIGFWIIEIVCLITTFFKYRKYNRYADRFKDVYPDKK